MDYTNEDNESIMLREPLPDYGKRKLSIEEYLEFERAAHEKHEYYRGEIFAMAGAGTEHNIIFSNVFGDIGYRTKGTNCRPFGSDMRMHIPENTLFTYPDIAIYCKNISSLWGSTDDNIKNPTVIIEILSISTQRYDRTSKLKFYQDIPSLKQYIMIDSRKICVESYTKANDVNWIFETFKNLEDTLIIKSIDLSLPLKDIYTDTGLDGKPKLRIAHH